MNERDIFIEALDKSSPEERCSWLDQACGNNPELRSRVELLLRAHDDADSMLDHPVLGDGSAETMCGPTDRVPPQPPEADLDQDEIALDFLEPSEQPDHIGRLGQFQVREAIGHGGMGVVLKANDPKLNRIVAIKVLASHFAANATARKRFLREARAVRVPRGLSSGGCIRQVEQAGLLRICVTTVRARHVLLSEEKTMRYRPVLAPGKIVVLAIFFVYSGIHSRAQQKKAEHTRGVELPFGHRPKAQEIRDWINSHPREGRKEAIAAFHEQIGKPYLDRTRKQPEYKPPGISDADTREFVFKRTPVRNLKLFVDYPMDWKTSDRRPAIVFWHGGGFTQGNAGQFYHQANYFTGRGAVCFRPEYRVRDTDDTLPVSSVEDGISAIRWIKQRANEFGIDPERIAVGGGSAGGCMAAAVATVDAKKFAELGFVGKEDNQTIDTSVSAMILYNPFLDFFEPTHPRHIEEECLFLGKDPEDYREALHAISAIENVRKDSPPNIILFGTKDAFCVSDLRWIVKCREIGARCQDFVYKGEVHSWYNNSPHLEYTTHNVNEFLVDIGFLDRQPEVELPHKEISAGRSDIQDAKYSGKKDWDEIPQYRRYREENNIKLIPFKENSQLKRNRR